MPWIGVWLTGHTQTNWMVRLKEPWLIESNPFGERSPVVFSRVLRPVLSDISISYLDGGTECTFSKFAYNRKCAELLICLRVGKLQRHLHRLDPWAKACLMTRNKDKCTWVITILCSDIDMGKSGVHQKQCGQQDEGSDCPLVRSNCETAP